MFQSIHLEKQKHTCCLSDIVGVELGVRGCNGLVSQLDYQSGEQIKIEHGSIDNRSLNECFDKSSLSTRVLVVFREINSKQLGLSFGADIYPIHIPFYTVTVFI